MLNVQQVRLFSKGLRKEDIQRAAADNPQRIRTDMDVRGIEQQQVFRQKNLPLNSVHGRTLFNRPWMAGVSSRSKFSYRKLVVKQCTGRTLLSDVISDSQLIKIFFHRVFTPVVSLLIITKKEMGTSCFMMK